MSGYDRRLLWTRNPGRYPRPLHRAAPELERAKCHGLYNITARDGAKDIYVNNSGWKLFVYGSNAEEWKIIGRE